MIYSSRYNLSLKKEEWNRPNYQERQILFCNNCKKRGHIKENCRLLNKTTINIIQESKESPKKV